MLQVAEVPPFQRSEFIQALAESVKTTRNASSHLGMLLIDIANLSRINHSQGYPVGDQVLARSYAELLSMSKLPDTVFRVASHCFAFILPELDHPALITLAVNRVSSIAQLESLTGAAGTAVDIRVGVAVNHGGNTDALDMLAAAESSLAHVKAGGELRLEFLLDDEREEQDISQQEQELERAVLENDFELYYQPKVNLLTNRMESVEALLRWSSSESGFVSPEKVVGFAEKLGRSFALTKWIVHQAVRQQKSWKDTLGISVAINVQAGLVSSPDLLPLLRDAMAIWGAEPSDIVLEITENAIIEDKEAGFNSLAQIRDLGMRISIDDFGTGYSSLSYFKYIPASELKVDKSFVHSMTVNSQELELVKIMIQIARKFGMSVVAEGIEDEKTLNLLRELGCDLGQGYYFAQPMTAAELEQWADSWHARSESQRDSRQV